MTTQSSEPTDAASALAGALRAQGDVYGWNLLNPMEAAAEAILAALPAGWKLVYEPELLALREQSQRLRSGLIEVVRLNPDSPGSDYAKRVLRDQEGGHTCPK